MHIYITHPEVTIDATVPVPRWGLSPIGRSRATAYAARDVLPHGAPIYASTEQKATDLAGILAAATGSRVEEMEALGENDRSATGYLSAPEFEQLVDRFFGSPDESAEGWETARDAQARIVTAVSEIVAKHRGEQVIFCGHGGVGTLLKCHVSGRGIARHEDQREMGWVGGGNCFAFELNPPRLLTDWQPMERFST
jgi:broad specificity phosphatase PhoE